MTNFQNTNHLIERLKLSSDFVKSISINQLQKQEIIGEAGLNDKPNHIDMKIIFQNLLNLESLSIYYG